MGCCRLPCSVLSHQRLLTRLDTVASSAHVPVSLAAGLSVVLEPNFKAAWIWVVREMGGKTLEVSLVYLTPRTLMASHSLPRLANMPGMLSTKLNCFPFSSHFYLTIILCFCFFFCLALKKNNITKFPNVHSRVRISSSTPVVEDTQSWQASLFT